MPTMRRHQLRQLHSEELQHISSASSDVGVSVRITPLLQSMAMLRGALAIRRHERSLPAFAL